jgi:hypothetical protein
MSTDSKTEATPDAAADPATALCSFWTQWLEQSTRGTQAMLEAMQTANDPQQAQRHWIDAVSRSTEEFMRTPVFMEVMKRSLKMMTDLKVLQDQALQGAARQLGQPLASDITGLFERLKSAETGLFERLNRTEQTIVSRLQAIEDRLKTVEAKLNSSPGHRSTAHRVPDEASKA